MMNTTKIFQTSWSLMLRYRALWIFGVLLALTTISFGSALWLRDNQEMPERTLVNWEINSRDQAWIKENFGLDLPLHYTLQVKDLSVRLDDPSLSPQEKSRLITITISLLVTLLVLFILRMVLRYTAETALMTMVNDQQTRNIEYPARKGWSLGFSMTAFKLFLIDLVVFSLLLFLTPLLFLPAMLPVLIAISGTPAGITIGILLMTALSLVSLAALVIMWLAGLVTVRLAFRACCLEGLGVFASIWRGFYLMRTRLSGVGLTWLVITGLDLVYPILAAPVGILLAAAGLTAGGLLALLVGALLALVLAKATAWTIAIIVGGVLCVLAVAGPMTLLGGLREVFKSSAWTLTFNEAVSYQSVESAPAPKPVLPQVSAA